MNRQAFLTLSTVVAFSIGTFVLSFPVFFLEQVKGADVSPAAIVMTRTTGVLLICVGILNGLVRKHDPSETLRSVLLLNAFLHFGLFPIGIVAYVTGTFSTLGSFLPNSILHIIFGLTAVWVRKNRCAL